jgi:hypothetical protein
MLITEKYRQTLEPSVGEEIGNCGGYAYVVKVYSKFKVKVKCFSDYFDCECDRGTNGMLMAVKPCDKTN